MPAPDYNPLLDPWYGASGNGPSTPTTGGGGDVDLTAVEARLDGLEEDFGDFGLVVNRVTALEGTDAGREVRLTLAEESLEDAIANVALTLQTREAFNFKSARECPVYLNTVPGDVSPPYVLMVDNGDGTISITLEEGSIL